MGAWEETQNYTDILLAEGFWSLRQASEVYPPDAQVSESAGNYLISLDGQPLYAGEAGNLAARLGRHFSDNRSDLLRKYRTRMGKELDLKRCRAQYLSVSVGRKELEEFAIVNALCPLNVKHTTSRFRSARAAGDGAWRSVQAMAKQVIYDGVTVATKLCDECWEACRPSGASGVYLVRNGLSVIYVGESDDMAERHVTHSQRTRFSSLRRNLARDILGYALGPRTAPMMGLTTVQDSHITSFLVGCRYAALPVRLGRLELEAALIQHCRPRLNRKRACDVHRGAVLGQE